MKAGWTTLLRALREPGAMAGFDADTWDLLLRQASSAGLLGRLAALAQQAGVEGGLPTPVRRHLCAASTIAEQQQRAVRWELVQLAPVLGRLDGPVLLLKGAAYAAAGLPPAAGRLFSDIDLLVPKAQIATAEALLTFDGWVSSHHSEYDQRYYRQWMHELPPMTHIRRRTVLDLHHNILPETARIQTRPDLILASARALPEHPRFSIPAPADLVLHSATHLFHEGEWQHGLRDLVDLDALLRAQGADPEFWDGLIARAALLNLGRPLFYGLRYCERLLATPVPAGLLQRCPGRPGPRAAAAMDALFMPALATAHHSCRRPGSGFAAWALYVRSHWLRMPPHLLLPHLAQKFWQTHVIERFAADDAAPRDGQRPDPQR
ncbi:MAG: nucleotidyltransferase family protein [Rubrivivax sp.]|nr:nucleotidyltransferase family protein [Rubrivivax sp.]